MQLRRRMRSLLPSLFLGPLLGRFLQRHLPRSLSRSPARSLSTARGMIIAGNSGSAWLLRGFVPRSSTRLEGDATATFGPTVFANESVRFVSYGAGPKIAWRQRQWEPWMHAIIGGAHLRPQTAGSSNALAIQLGGGVDYRVNPRLSVRLDADWVFTRFFSQSQNSAQAAVSAIFHF